MTTFNTGNPIGSAAAKDLYDNAENLDEFVNSKDKLSHPDRLGVPRKTWHGMEEDFQSFLQSSGYQDLGDYAPGIEITARNQIIRADGELWRISASVELPYTTSGDWAADSGDFVAMGDAVLRQELADPTHGGELVNVATSTGEQTLAEALDQRVISVGTIDELKSLPDSVLSEGFSCSVTKTGRSGLFTFRSGDQSSNISNDPESIVWVAPVDSPSGSSGAWERLLNNSGEINIEWAGAVGDYNEDSGIGTNNRTAIQAACSYVSNVLGGGRVLIQGGPLGSDYLITQSINVTGSNVHVYISPDAHLRLRGTTSFGHAICFLSPNSLLSPPVYDDQRENVGIYGGGTVTAWDDTGDNENAIGFVNAKNFFCIGMNLPDSNRKAITAQINVQDGLIWDNHIGHAHGDAITVQGAFREEDSALPLKNIVVAGNRIKSTSGRGVYTTRLFSADARDIVFSDNVVESSVLPGTEMRGIINPVHRGNKTYGGSAGSVFRDCHNVVGDIYSEGASGFGVHMLSFDSSILFREFNFSNVYVKNCGQDVIRMTSIRGGGHIGRMVVDGVSHEYIYRVLGSTQEKKITIGSLEGQGGTLGKFSLPNDGFYPWLPVEHGSGAAGTFTKYPDGTLVRTRVVEYDFSTPTSVTYAYQGPDSFVETPSASISFQNTSLAARHSAFAGTVVMASAGPDGGWRIANTATTSETLTVAIAATGRWRATGPFDRA